VLAFLLVLVPAGLLGWMRLRTEDRLGDVTATPDPVVLQIAEVEDWGDRSVYVSIEWGEPVEVAAPSWSGVVTDVYVAPGDKVASGGQVVQIDRIDRIAASTPVPFSRPLARRDEGPDVMMLQELLASWGLYEGEMDGDYGAGTVAAVKEWAAGLGVLKPSGGFDPAWLVWLPASEFEVGAIPAQVGFPAPAAGSAILIGPTPIIDVVINDPAAAISGFDGTWVLRIGNDEYTLVDGRLTAESLELLASTATSEDRELSASVRRATPETTLEIPPSAIVTNADGSTCVWLETGGGFEPTMITLTAGSGIRVGAGPELEPGDAVLVNPLDVLPDPECR